MSAYVTREIIDTAARAEWDQYRPDLDGGPWEDLTEAQRASWREGVGVVLAAAIPLVTPAIEAQALRDAADGIDLSPSYPTPGLSELHNAESAAEAFLRARANELKAGSLAAIQVNGPGLEKSGDNSSLRDRIAEAINGGPLPEPGRDWEADMYQTQADAVIAALGLTEERRPGVTTTLNDSVWTRPDKRRYITDWKETP